MMLAMQATKLTLDDVSVESDMVLDTVCYVAANHIMRHSTPSEGEHELEDSAACE